jgi:N6-adenosine-specific RNA methylase IME4
MNEQDRPYHEISGLFPMMGPQEYANLKDDIATNGLQEPIWLHPDGSIIDGRNRHRACIELGLVPDFKTWNGEGSLVLFAISLNLKRRHLTSDQRAVLSLHVLPMLEKENPPGAANPKYGINSVFGLGENREQAARYFQTNAKYISMAKQLEERAPDLLEEVWLGDKTLRAARWELIRRERQDAPPMPTEKYRVLYADPPWEYARTDLDGYGHTDRHYPSMTLDELFAMREDIDGIIEDDAVLFLWATSPLLPGALRLIQAWGFSYKASFVWDKVRHNYGHYNSVRHELLLVGTKGSCTPDVPKLIDSVQTIERTETHSEKPEEFREIIDTLYPHGSRLELFARKDGIDGWDFWGNEPG